MCSGILSRNHLHHRVHAMGTDFEGHIDQVLKVVKEMQQAVHASGVPKVEMHLVMSSRSDHPVKSIDDRQ